MIWPLGCLRSCLEVFVVGGCAVSRFGSGGEGLMPEGCGQLQDKSLQVVNADEFSGLSYSAFHHTLCSRRSSSVPHITLISPVVSTVLFHYPNITLI